MLISSKFIFNTTLENIFFPIVVEAKIIILKGFSLFLDIYNKNIIIYLNFYYAIIPQT